MRNFEDLYIQVTIIYNVVSVFLRHSVDGYHKSEMCSQLTMSALQPSS